MTISTRHRSHSFHYTVKHYFEASFIGGHPSFHIGFSPSDSERIMTSYLQLNGNQHLYQRTSIDDEEFFTTQKAEAIQGEQILVCFDSVKNNLIAVKGTKRSEFTIPPFQTASRWYAYVDGSQNISSKNPVKLSVNLGFTDFSNSIPEGFYPWIYGIDGVILEKKQYTCSFTLSHIHISTIFFYFLIKQ